MFPINYNDPYTKNDGSVVPVGDVIGGGGGSELPEYSSSDAGKVLTVGEDGELEWNESGAGGGEIIRDIFQPYTESGSHELLETVEIESSGTYNVICGGFCSRLWFKINNVIQDNSFEDGGAFCHYYNNSSLSLQSGDTIIFDMSSSGKTLFFVKLIKVS